MTLPLPSNAFTIPRKVPWRVLDREIAESIYKHKGPEGSVNGRLHVLCGIRTGELLKIKVSDVSDRNLILRKVKSRKESEVAFIPEQKSKRLRGYTRSSNSVPRTGY